MASSPLLISSISKQQLIGKGGSSTTTTTITNRKGHYHHRRRRLKFVFAFIVLSGLFHYLLIEKKYNYNYYSYYHDGSLDDDAINDSLMIFFDEPTITMTSKEIKNLSRKKKQQDQQEQQSQLQDDPDTTPTKTISPTITTVVVTTDDDATTNTNAKTTTTTTTTTTTSNLITTSNKYGDTTTHSSSNLTTKKDANLHLSQQQQAAAADITDHGATTTRMQKGNTKNTNDMTNINQTYYDHYSSSPSSDVNPSSVVTTATATATTTTTTITDTDDDDDKIILWIDSTVILDMNFIIYESYVSERFKHLEFVMDKDDKVEIRRCKRGQPQQCPPLSSNNDNGNNNTMHEEVEAEERRNDRWLVFCYPTTKKRKEISKRDIIAITTTTTNNNASFNNKTTGGGVIKKIIYYRNIYTESENCPNKCHHHDYHHHHHQQQQSLPSSSLYNDSWWWGFDPIDKLCKSIHPSAIPPIRRFGGSCDCQTTCYTPNAVQLMNNSSWPWRSFEERNKYYGSSSSNETTTTTTTTTTTNDDDLSLQKKIWSNERRHASYQMRFLCNKKEENEIIIKPTTTTTTIATKVKNQTNNITTTNTTMKQQRMITKIDLPGPAYTAFSHHFFFIPQAKLMFCGVPKVGITEWLKFLRYTYGAKDYLSLPHFKADKDVFMMGSLSIEKANELLNDPTWTLAMFIRDPAERLLSAYSDKIRKPGYSRQYFKRHNKGTEGYMTGLNNNNNNNNTTTTTGGGSNQKQPPAYYVLSFNEFVNLVTFDNTVNTNDPRGLHGRTDPHWRPQSMMCGMDYLLPRVDFIGNFNYVAEHTKILLQNVGLWEKYGSTFDPADDNIKPKGKEGICMIPPPSMLRDKTNTAANFTPTGFNQVGPTVTTGHLTGSKSKMDEYYTPELLSKVRRAYHYDYSIWDDIKNQPIDNVLSGKDLNIVKSHCG